MQTYFLLQILLSKMDSNCFLHFRFFDLCALLLICHDRYLVGFQRFLVHGLNELMHERIRRKNVNWSPACVIVMIFTRSLPDIKQNVSCGIGICRQVFNILMNSQVPGSFRIFVTMTWHCPRQILCPVKRSIQRKMDFNYFTKLLHSFFNYFQRTQHRFCTILTRTWGTGLLQDCRTKFRPPLVLVDICR